VQHILAIPIKHGREDKYPRCLLKINTSIRVFNHV
jgi:hypothetical protein